MSRWGEEEKKNKGLFGCAIAFTVLGLSLYIFYINYANLEGRRNLEREMQGVIRTGYDKSEQVMIAEIREAAEKLGLELDDDHIDLEKYYDDHNNPVVDVRIDFAFTVDLLVAKWDVAIPIVEEVTIVTF